MPVINVELPEQEIERLTIEAERRNMSVPELVAEQVKSHVNGAASEHSPDEISDEEFDGIVTYVINKNRELLERLA
jgi:hypothetical protein